MKQNVTENAIWREFCVEKSIFDNAEEWRGHNIKEVESALCIT